MSWQSALGAPKLFATLAACRVGHAAHPSRIDPGVEREAFALVHVRRTSG